MYLQMNLAATITAAWKLSTQTGRHRKIQETLQVKHKQVKHKPESTLNTQTRCVIHTFSRPPMEYIPSPISASTGAQAMNDHYHAESEP